MLPINRLLFGMCENCAISQLFVNAESQLFFGVGEEGSMLAQCSRKEANSLTLQEVGLAVPLLLPTNNFPGGRVGHAVLVSHGL